ncbi:hypothetical protein ACIQB5_45950 [Streptomyces sp. NPDC088560]|uniref:hypothetical protein n=1 Tax=Streptomyces sp. NPDC088560 TaxID=3365868 RepID=UPI00381A0C7C
MPRRIHIDTAERPGRRLRAVQRTVSWLSGHPEHLVLLGLAAALCRHQRPLELTTQETVLAAGGYYRGRR